MNSIFTKSPNRYANQEPETSEAFSTSIKFNLEAISKWSFGLDISFILPTFLISKLSLSDVPSGEVFEIKLGIFTHRFKKS